MQLAATLLPDPLLPALTPRCPHTAPSLLTVLYSQVSHAMKIHDRLDAAEAELDEIKGIKRTPAPTTKQQLAGTASCFRATHQACLRPDTAVLT